LRLFADFASVMSLEMSLDAAIFEEDFPEILVRTLRGGSLGWSFQPSKHRAVRFAVDLEIMLVPALSGSPARSQLVDAIR
jgi:hypothetical protein